MAERGYRSRTYSAWRRQPDGRNLPSGVTISIKLTVDVGLNWVYLRDKTHY
jgi:hypothetical protein